MMLSLSREEFDAVFNVLQQMHAVVEATYAHDGEGNRLEGEEPGRSGADIFEYVCNLEYAVLEAITILSRAEAANPVNPVKEKQT
jgi:hypothetical protein